MVISMVETELDAGPVAVCSAGVYIAFGVLATAAVSRFCGVVLVKAAQRSNLILFR